jgi:DNA-directed RNA polymerase specialized sigma24 family protein
MAALPPEQRQLLAWDALGENSSVIGQRLGINASTVRSRLASARAALKSEVERLMPSDNSPTRPTTEQLGGDA